MQIPTFDPGILLRGVSVELVLRYIAFLTLLVGPVILFVLFRTIRDMKPKPEIWGLLLGAGVGAVGTLLLFGAFSSFKNPLSLQYLLSDSRFFLSTTLIVLIVVSTYLSKTPELETRSKSTVKE